MIIKTTKDMSFIDVKVPKGTVAQVLTKKDLYQLQDRELRRDLTIARRTYEKREIEGVFAMLKGKWRWVYQTDYKETKRVSL